MDGRRAGWALSLFGTFRMVVMLVPVPGIDSFARWAFSDRTWMAATSRPVTNLR
jgi:hypothetical protein